MKTGLVYDTRFLKHNPGAGHPETADRLTAIHAHLQKQPWFSDLRPVAPKPATEDWITTVHSLDYIARAQEYCEQGHRHLDTLDVGISPDSFEVAKLAVGAGLTLADEMMAGRIQNGFALIRPPGHHAEQDYAMGFCLFNNIAILAKYLQKQHGLEKVVILDWDVHHGNGTQHTFEEDTSVFYISLHQYPYYPGTGAATETGVGRGQGATLNCPMPAGSGDPDYEKTFREKILPKMKGFKPDAILISAGFDAHAADPLADIRLSTHFFGWMTERVMEMADQYAKGRIISLLEGGYNLQVLPECVAQHVERMMGGKPRRSPAAP